MIYLCHLTGLTEAITGPEEGQDELLGELAHHRDVRVPPNDCVQLKPRLEGERETKLCMDVNVRLVILVPWPHADDRIPERGVGLGYRGRLVGFQPTATKVDGNHLVEVWE